MFFSFLPDRMFGGREFRNVLPSLLLLTSVFFLTFFSRIIFSPLLPLLEQEFNIQHTEGVSLFFCIAIGYVLAILLSPFLSAKIGNKKTIVCAAIGCGFLLILFSFCRTLFACQLISLFLGGFAGLYLPSGLITIVELTPSLYLTRGMAIHEIAPNMGFILTPVVGSLLISLCDWRTGLHILGWVFMFWGLIYGRFGYDCARLQQPLSFVLVKEMFSKRLFRRITLMLCFAISSTIGVYSILPLLLVSEHAMSAENANGLVALSRVGTVFMPFVGGWLGDRFGNGRMLVYILFFTGLVTLPLGFFTGWKLIVCVIVQPLIAVMFFPCCFALFATFGGEKVKGVAISLGIPIGFLVGGGVLPFIIGVIGDFWGLSYGVFSVGAMMVVVSIVAGQGRVHLQGKRS